MLPDWKNCKNLIIVFAFLSTSCIVRETTTYIEGYEIDKKKETLWICEPLFK